MIMKDFSKTQKQNILINTKLKNLQMSFNDQDKGNLYLIKEKESVDFELKFPQQRYDMVRHLNRMRISFLSFEKNLLIGKL